MLMGMKRSSSQGVIDSFIFRQHGDVPGSLQMGCLHWIFAVVTKIGDRLSSPEGSRIANDNGILSTQIANGKNSCIHLC